MLSWCLSQHCRSQLKMWQSVCDIQNLMVVCVCVRGTCATVSGGAKRWCEMNVISSTFSLSLDDSGAAR